MDYKEADYREAIRHLREREKLLKQTTNSCNDMIEEISFSEGAIGRLTIRIPELEEELANARERLPKLQDRVAVLKPSLKSHMASREVQMEQVALSKKRIKLLEQLKQTERDMK